MSPVGYVIISVVVTAAMIASVYLFVSILNNRAREQREIHYRIFKLEGTVKYLKKETMTRADVRRALEALAKEK